MTDEIFGVSASQEGRISPWYNYGVMCVAIPGWTLGTLAGAVSGSLLPDFLVSALSVAIYGMFLAVIIPPAKKNRAVLGVVIGAMAVSTLFAVVPVLNKVSTGFVIIITTSDGGRVGSCLFLPGSGRKTTARKPERKRLWQTDMNTECYICIFW